MTVEIARDRSKILKKEKKKREMRKNQTTAFYFYFFIQENLYFVRKHIWKNIVYTATFALRLFLRGRLWEMQ